jgi:hypothetical protein
MVSVDDHRANIEVFEEEIRTLRDTNVKGLATKTLSVLKQPLASVEAMAKRSSSMTCRSDSLPPAAATGMARPGKIWDARTVMLRLRATHHLRHCRQLGDGDA